MSPGLLRRLSDEALRARRAHHPSRRESLDEGKRVEEHRQEGHV